MVPVAGICLKGCIWGAIGGEYIPSQTFSSLPPQEQLAATFSLALGFSCCDNIMVASMLWSMLELLSFADNRFVHFHGFTPKGQRSVATYSSRIHTRAPHTATIAQTQEACWHRSSSVPNGRRLLWHRGTAKLPQRISRDRDANSWPPFFTLPCCVKISTRQFLNVQNAKFSCC